MADKPAGQGLMYFIMGASMLIGALAGVTLVVRADALLGEAADTSHTAMQQLGTGWLQAQTQNRALMLQQAAQPIETELLAAAEHLAGQVGEAKRLGGEALSRAIDSATRPLVRQSGVRTVLFYDAALSPHQGGGSTNMLEAARNALRGAPGRLVSGSVGDEPMTSLSAAVPVIREGVVLGALVVQVEPEQLTRAWRIADGDSLGTGLLLNSDGVPLGGAHKPVPAVQAALKTLGAEGVVDTQLDFAARRVNLLGGVYLCVVETGQQPWHAQVSGIAAIHARLRWLLGVCACLLAVAMVAVPLYLTPHVREYRQSTHILRNAVGRACAGDFTAQVQDPGQDDIAVINRRFGDMVTSLRQNLSDIKAEAAGLANEAADLAKVAEHMVQQTKNMTATTQSVASTTDEITTNVHSVAAAIEESSSNVRSVAAAVEQISANLRTVASNAQDTISSIDNVNESIRVMSGAVDEVATRAKKATGVMARAIDVAQRTSSTIAVLGQSANEIGRVVSVITDIADKTNLLALNATIEAASAGDAGRGFAVVANEVKELAKQTARATEEIRYKIEGIQTNTRESVGAISEIVNTIDEVNVMSGEISQAVSLQGDASRRVQAAVREATNSAQVIQRSAYDASVGANAVAHHADELAAGANSIARSAAEVAAGSQELSKSIRVVSEGVSDNNSGAQHFNSAAVQLATVSDHIARLLNGFST